MNAVITGDIIDSTQIAPEHWLKLLKSVLNTWGQQPQEWEIFRGDSFQVLLPDAMDALYVAIAIKAALKSSKLLDARMAIGLGPVTYRASRITESNGEAFVFSGEKFEQLKKEKVNLAIRSAWPEFDRDMNLYLKFALITMDDWTENSAEMVKLALDYPRRSQQELGEHLGIKQNTVSTRLRRAQYDVIEDLLNIYRVKLKEIHGAAS